MARKPTREPLLAGGAVPDRMAVGSSRIVADPGAIEPAPQRASIDILAVELGALTATDTAALRAKWRRLYRADSPPKLGRYLLELAVAWKLQERALGGLGANARRQLAELAGALTDGSDLPKARRVSLKPGARLLRSWGGQTHEVLVVEGGFLWQDRVWRSLSMIAREITGTRWSGPRFFGLDRAGPSGRGGAAEEGAGADANA